MDDWFWSLLSSWWDAYTANSTDITPWLAPLATVITGVLTLIVGYRVASAAMKQAETARERHEAQTDADQQRRITDSFTKAVEQLGSDKLQVRHGGIYTLEQISRESTEDALSHWYWPIMETLTAFVRERARWKDEDVAVSQTVARLYQETAAQQLTPSPPTDIEGVLTVIKRREERNREREKSEGWRLDLGLTDLRGADLGQAHLERAILIWAHLEGANLEKAYLEGAYLTQAHLEEAYLEGAHLERAGLGQAHLERAILIGAHLEGANLEKAYLEGAILIWAHLEGANLEGAHLERADLLQAHLEGAFLGRAHLEGAILMEAHLEGADLRDAIGLTQDQLDNAVGNAETRLPKGLNRPAHWPK